MHPSTADRQHNDYYILIEPIAERKATSVFARRVMLVSTYSVEGEQVCSECSGDVGNDFARLSPCQHNVCFRCLSRLLAEKLPTDALACPSCSENVTAHAECRINDDNSGAGNILNTVKHRSLPQMPSSPERRKDDDGGEGRKVATSPRRLRRTKSKMRVLKSLSEDEQPLKEINEECDDDNSENNDGKNKRDNDVDRKADKASSHRSTRQGENYRGRDNSDEERPTQPRESGNSNSSSTRPPSSRPNARSLRCSSSRRLSPDKLSQSRSQSKDDSEHADDKKQTRRRSKSLSSSRHGQLRTKSMTNSEHGGDGRSSRRRTSSGEDSAHSTASKLSSKSNGDKQQRSRRGQTRQSDPPTKATDDSSSVSSSDPARVGGKVTDDGDLSASESDSKRAKEGIANLTTKPEPSQSPEGNGAGSEKGRKLVTQMKAIAKLAILGRGLAQSPRKPMKGQKVTSLNNDNDDSDR